MSRTSVFIQYAVAFSGAHRLRASNNLYEADWTVDADVEVTMRYGTAGTAFTIKLYDLPRSQSQALYDASGAPNDPRLSVTIRLGYYDGAFETVIDEGVVTSVKESATEDGRSVTTVDGQERALFWLHHTPLNQCFDESDIAGTVRALLSQTGLGARGVTTEPVLENVDGAVTPSVYAGEHVIDALEALSVLANADLLVVDNTVRLGRPVTYDSREDTPPLFAPQTNLVRFTPFVKSIPDPSAQNGLDAVTRSEARGYDFTLLGDPSLRPGQRVTAQVESFGAAEPGSTFRVVELKHRFSHTSGYRLEGRTLKVADDAQRVDASSQSASPDNALRQLQRLMQRSSTPAVQVGQIDAHAPKTVRGTSLFYDQDPERTEQQPSVRTPVETDDQKRFLEKPVASSFAWRKCGQVVPSYPGMRAVVLRHRDRRDDVFVAGYLWTETPEAEPPPAETGDWWLCLPVDFDASEPPPDDTSTANDLVTNTGLRVMQVKGLRVMVGADQLPSLGTRPSPGADDEFVVEHASGTTVAIASDGAVRIASDAGITLQGDVVIEGTLDIR